MHLVIGTDIDRVVNFAANTFLSVQHTEQVK